MYISDSVQNSDEDMNNQQQVNTSTGGSIAIACQETSTTPQGAQYYLGQLVDVQEPLHNWGVGDEFTYKIQNNHDEQWLIEKMGDVLPYDEDDTLGLHAC